MGEFSNAMGKYFDVFEANALYKNGTLLNALLNVLKVSMHDVKDDWIGYYIHELGFGEDDGVQSAFRKDKTHIPLSTHGELYDFLVELMGE